MSSAEEIDALSKAAVKNPSGRVSLDDIKAQIVEVYYVRALDAAVMARTSAPPGEENPDIELPQGGWTPHDWVNHPLRTMTLCFLVLKNGFISVGKTAAADLQNVDVELAKKFSYDDAIRQLWPILAYEKRTELSQKSE